MALNEEGDAAIPLLARPEAGGAISAVQGCFQACDRLMAMLAPEAVQGPGAEVEGGGLPCPAFDDATVRERLAALLTAASVEGNLEKVKVVLAYRRADGLGFVACDTKNAFVEACGRGRLEVVKMLWGYRDATGAGLTLDAVRAFRCAALRRAAMAGHLEVLEYLWALQEPWTRPMPFYGPAYDSLDIDDVVISSALPLAICWKQWRVARWLWGLQDARDQTMTVEVLRGGACFPYRHPVTAQGKHQYNIDSRTTRRAEKYRAFFEGAGLPNLFTQVCGLGDLEGAKFLWELRDSRGDSLTVKDVEGGPPAALPSEAARESGNQELCCWLMERLLPPQTKSLLFRVVLPPA